MPANCIRFAAPLLEPDKTRLRNPSYCFLLLPQAGCGRDIHRSGWEKQQGESAGDYAHEAKFDYGQGQLAGGVPFLYTGQNASRDAVCHA
jgi:hypothetical protein